MSYRPTRARISKLFKEPRNRFLGINSSAPSTFTNSCSEPVFVDHLRSPGIDSHPGGPVRQPYFSYLVDGFDFWNRFLGSIKYYKYGLWLSRLAESIPGLLNSLKISAPCPPIGQNCYHQGYLPAIS